MKTTLTTGGDMTPEDINQLAATAIRKANILYDFADTDAEELDELDRCIRALRDAALTSSQPIAPTGREARLEGTLRMIRNHTGVSANQIAMIDDALGSKGSQPVAEAGELPVPDLHGIDTATMAEWRTLRVKSDTELMLVFDLPTVIQRAILADRAARQPVVPAGMWLAPMQMDAAMREACCTYSQDFALASNGWRAARDSWLARHPLPAASEVKP